MHLSAYAAGYRRLYQSDEEELTAALGENRAARGGTGDPSDPRLFWWPSSVDFRDQAARRPEGAPVADFSALLVAIRRMNNLTSVHWFGHGSASGELQFGNRHNFGTDQLAALKKADVSSHFAPGGRVTFFACNVGQKADFLQGIASALRVTVAGFQTGVRWELRFRGESPRRAIYYRGVRGDKLPVPTSTNIFEPK